MHKRLFVLLCTAFVLLATPTLATAQTSTSTDATLTTQATTRARKNNKAHATYYKQLSAMQKKGMIIQGVPNYCFVDLTGDGVDEMIVQWWPSIYTYRSRKAVCVHDGEIGSSSYAKLYRTKKVFVHVSPDHMGSSYKSYYKWNGKKFVTVATTYTPSTLGKQQGAKAYHWIKGKGKVSKKRVKAYIKKLTKGAKATKPAYVEY